jgi:glycosyltransferase involved in cell wall biosynthesis
VKILLIADPMLPVPPKHYGGIERIIDMLCQEYDKAGHDVRLIAHPESNTAGKLIPLPGMNFASRIDLVKNSLTLKKEAERFRPDVIHSFGRLAQLLPILRSSVPKVMSYQREPSLTGIRRAAWLARRNTLFFTGCSNYISNQISAVTNARTVYNGVPLGSFHFRESISDDAPLVFLGRIEHIKGVHNAIAIARASGRKLIIAGNIPDSSEHRAYFETKVKQELDSQITYIGPVDDTQKNELLGNAFAMIMAIEWNEPFGIVMAEALACGTPVLGTRMGAVPEVIDDGVTGFVRDSPSELIECVPKLKLIHRKKCRDICQTRFSDQVVARKYLQLYSSLQTND